MTNYEINILKKALLKVEQKELHRFKNLQNENVEISEEFENNIYKLARKRKTFIWQATKTVPRKIAVVFIAAIITFCMMMSISAIRIPVINFFVNVYEEFISIFVDEEEGYIKPQTIVSVSLPSYTIEGYYLEDSQNYGQDAESIWFNENGEVIILSQHILENEFQSFIDNKNLNFQTENANGLTLYFVVKNQYYQIFWTKNGYLFSLNCSETIPFAKIKEMISSIS